MRDAAYEQNRCGTALQMRATQQTAPLYEAQHQRTTFLPTQNYCCWKPRGIGLAAWQKLRLLNATLGNTISHLTEGSGIVSYARFTESNGITPYIQGSSSSRTILCDVWHCYAAAAALSLLKSTCRDGSTSANWVEQPFTMVPTPFTMKNGDLLPSW